MTFFFIDRNINENIYDQDLTALLTSSSFIDIELCAQCSLLLIPSPPLPPNTGCNADNFLISLFKKCQHFQP